MANKLRTILSKLFGEFSHFDDIEKTKPFHNDSSSANPNKNLQKNNFNSNMENTEIPVEHTENATEDITLDTAAEATTETENVAEGSADNTGNDAATAKMVEMEAQVSELKDKYLRLAAEFDNYKRRMSKERLELMDTAAKDTIAALLPVLDDFDRAAKANETATEVAGVVEGFKLIHNRMLNILKQRGLVEMDTNKQDFDADKHEAIAEMPMGDEFKGKVFDTTEKGYLIKEKIIRFAKVVVGR
jgi:molecular chaperone GrpE